MEKYKLIALDMDGTLLNSQKEISNITHQALEKAIEADKYVVLSTGRSICELKDYQKEFANIQYGICESGALIYDFKNKKIIHQSTFPLEIIKKILAAGEHEDVVTHVFSDGQAYLSHQDFSKIDEHQMGVYRDMYNRVVNFVDDVTPYLFNNKIEKINFYHLNSEARARTYERLKDLPVSLALTEATSLEISPLNVTKGTGLIKLCEYLNLDIAKTIAVGDSNNDFEVLKTAGLAVAMNNAIDEIKEICDVVVADNDHDGCKEAIDNYLLK